MSENQQIASQAHHRLFAERDVSVLDELFAEDFVEHSPLVADGRAGLRAMVEEAGDALTYTCSRELADGDLVALHGRFTGLDETPLVGFDLYRVADGKVVEHWDGLVPEASEPNASGRTQLDGTAQPSAGQDAEGNREKVLNVLFERGLIGQDYSVFRELTRDDVFVQHSPDIADGAEAAVPVVPVVDSIRRVDDAGSAVVDRAPLRAVQTPQGARLGALRRAHAAAHHS